MKPLRKQAHDTLSLTFPFSPSPRNSFFTGTTLQGTMEETTDYSLDLKNQFLQKEGWTVQCIIADNGKQNWIYETPQKHKRYYDVEDVATVLFDAGITWNKLARKHAAATYHVPNFSNWIKELKADRLALLQIQRKLSEVDPIPTKDVPIVHTLYYVTQRLQFCIDQLNQWMDGNEIFMCRRAVPGDMVHPNFALAKYRRYAAATVTAELPRNMGDATLGSQNQNIVAVAVPEHETCKQGTEYLIAPIQHPELPHIYQPRKCPLTTSPSEFGNLMATSNNQPTSRDDDQSDSDDSSKTIRTFLLAYMSDSEKSYP